MVPPRAELGRVRFVRADIRNPVIAKVIAAEDVDTVVHTGVVATPGSAGGRSSMKEINVIGTMQLLAACQKAPGVAKLVVKSSTDGVRRGPPDPAMFTEEMAPRADPQTGLSKDAVEVEGYVRGFARRRPDVCVTHAPDGELDRPQSRLPDHPVLRLPVIPTVFGFDARLQFLHETDLLDQVMAAREPPLHVYTWANNPRRAMLKGRHCVVLARGALWKCARPLPRHRREGRHVAARAASAPPTYPQTTRWPSQA